jgi:CheY-like chemotaxis protein
LTGPEANDNQPFEFEDDHSKKGRVLIAEDILTNRMVLKSLLETLEFEVLEAVNGVKAIEIFKSEPTINFILMDIQMPEMDGVEATIVIREWEEIKKLSQTPIIAVTAFDYAEDIKRCMDAGMNDVMFKPADLKVLNKVAEKYLRVKKIDWEALKLSKTEALIEKVLENRTEELFNEKWLNVFVSDHKKLASVILSSASKNIPEYFVLLEESIRNNSMIEAKAVVHVLKGLFHQIGAIRLSKILGEVNEKMKNGVVINEALYVGLVSEYQSLDKELQQWIQKNT